MMNKPKHADIIAAYAEGKEIELLSQNRWVPLNTSKAVIFCNDVVYRVKPEETVTNFYYSELQNAFIPYGPGIDEQQVPCSIRVAKNKNTGNLKVTVVRNKYDREFL